MLNPVIATANKTIISLCQDHALGNMTDEDYVGNLIRYTSQMGDELVKSAAANEVDNMVNEL